MTSLLSAAGTSQTIGSRDPFGQGSCGLLAAWIGIAALGENVAASRTLLAELGSVDPVQANPKPLDLQRIAVDRDGTTGNFGQHHTRYGQHQRNRQGGT
jgi:hypothetical protein